MPKKKNIACNVKVYKLYILKDGEFLYVKTTTSVGAVKNFIEDNELRFDFLRVDNFTEYNVGRKAGQKRLINSNIYLRGELVLRDRDILLGDLEELKKTLTKVYRVNGEVDYYPLFPLSCRDVRDVLHIKGSDWFSIAGVIKREDIEKKENEEVSNRWVILTYDWQQKGATNKPNKILNVKATNILGMELYGDVLYINENYIS